jgi:micrococcal nuclease
MRIVMGLAVLAALTTATAAKADPCKAIPDHGPMPSYLHRGAHFSGPVVYVGDGDSLCVAFGQGPANWVEIRLEDFYAPELHSPHRPRRQGRAGKGRHGSECGVRRQPPVLRPRGGHLPDRRALHRGLAEGRREHRGRQRIRRGHAIARRSTALRSCLKTDHKHRSAEPGDRPHTDRFPFSRTVVRPRTEPRERQYTRRAAAGRDRRSSGTPAL